MFEATPRNALPTLSGGGREGSTPVQEGYEDLPENVEKNLHSRKDQIGSGESGPLQVTLGG